MALLASWLIFPAVLGALSLGCGVLVERVAGVRIPGTLLLPVGFAVIICTAQLAVTTDATAELATPAVVLLALAGAAFYRSVPDRRPDGWAIGAALAVFAVFAAPIVLSGTATFAGYAKLDDTAAWLSITDHVMSHGRGVDSLATSFHKGLVRSYLSSGYPIGTFLPLGVARPFTGQDLAWVFQSYIAFLAALLTLSLYELATRVTASRQLRALAVFVAAQPAILVGYAFVGGIKEVLTVALLAPLAVLGFAAVKARVGARALLPLAFMTAAVVDALSYGAAFWLLPLLAPALLVAIRSEGAKPALRRAGAFALLTAAISLPALPAMVDFLGSSRTVLTSGGEFGSLVKPLSPLQLFGIWPTGDFRLNPSSLFVADVLIAIVIASGLAALALAWQRKAWDLLAYIGGSGVGCLAISLFGAPWVDGKSFAIASPALLLAGVVGVAAAARLRFFKGAPLLRINLLGTLAVTRLGLLAGFVGGLIAFGVLWSNVLAYHDANLAPRARFVELEKIGKLVDGKGPTLSTQFDLYDVTHFLRKGDPEGPWRVPLVDGSTIHGEQYVDLDEFNPRGVLSYRSLVVSRSPIASRPPSEYRLVWRGSFYDLWQRDARPATRILGRLPLGEAANRMPIAKPSCHRVLVLARLPGVKRLAAVAGSPTLIVRLGQLRHPGNWATVADDPDVVHPRGPGTMSFQFRLGGKPSPYHFWIGKAFRRRLALAVDGRRIGARAGELHPTTGFAPFGTASLGPGLHTVTLSYGGRTLAPGAADSGRPIDFGPVLISQGSPDHPVGLLRPSQARVLCGQTLDWVEALGS
jgi:hypothetical protein